MKKQFSLRKKQRGHLQRLIEHVNRKNWWHVPPVDPDAHQKRGKFLASSFEEAEFYGRPLNDRQKVVIRKPLIGDERAISRVLRIPPQSEGVTLKQIAAHDALWRNAALKKGFDSILLMAPVCFTEFKASGRIPRSLELNILEPSTPGKSPL